MKNLKYFILLAFFLCTCHADVKLDRHLLGFKIFNYKDVPIKVVADSRILAVEMAIAYWNDKVGCNLFTQVYTLEEANVILMIHEEEADLAGLTRCSMLIHKCMLDFFPFSQINILVSKWTVIHELGHAVGLMHNPDDSDDLMYPSIPWFLAYRLGENKNLNWYTTEKNVNLLKGRFCAR